MYSLTQSKGRGLDYLAVMRTGALALIFLLAGSAGPAKEPIAVPLAAAFLSLGGSLLAVPAAAVLSALPAFSLYDFLAVLAGASILAAVCAAYRAKGARPGYELPAYTLLALLPYVFMPAQGSFAYKCAVSGCCAVLSLVFLAAARGLTVKGVGARFSTDETLGACVTLICMGLGANRLLGQDAWKAMSLLALLLSAALADKGFTLTLSVVLALPSALFYRDLTYTGVFPLLAALAVGLMPVSRYLAAAALPLADAVIGYFLGIYGAYSLVNLLVAALPAALFCAAPPKLLSAAAEKISALRERQLARAAINRNRALLSGKLFEISGVFSEMEALFRSMSGGEEGNGALKLAERMEKEVCAGCPFASACPKPDQTSADRLARVGLAKGKVSLIDLPADLSDVCKQPNHLLFGLNRLLAAGRESMLSRRAEDAGKELVAAQAGAVADILKGLALDTGKVLRYNAKLEKRAAKALAERGIAAGEVLAFGEGGEAEIGLICPPASAADKRILTALSRAAEMPLALETKTDITPEKCHLSFRRSPRYDAAFGVAARTKQGSPTSGDTHSLVRMSADKFLLALSDGMGSGDAAQSLSASALSLIESFYRAGMDGERVFSTVNRIFSLGAEDSFAAVDAATVDLSTGEADFIKIGAPYGFVFSEGGIRLIEASSLPLGILDELRPSTCSARLSAGDTVLLLSDGITDAFPSSTDMLEYLSGLPAKNPQSLAETVLERAAELYGGQAEDDMTAVAVRLFERRPA